MKKMSVICLTIKILLMNLNHNQDLFIHIFSEHLKEKNYKIKNKRNKIYKNKIKN